MSPHISPPPSCVLICLFFLLPSLLKTLFTSSCSIAWKETDSPAVLVSAGTLLLHSLFFLSVPLFTYGDGTWSGRKGEQRQPWTSCSCLQSPEWQKARVFLLFILYSSANCPTYYQAGFKKCRIFSTKAGHLVHSVCLSPSSG